MFFSGFKKIVGAALLLTATWSALAQQVIIPAPPQISATAYLLIDVNTGKVLVD